MLQEKAEDSPWLTTTDIERVSEELHYLKQFDQATNEYRDIRWMYFRLEVLNKYRNNHLCEIGGEYIRFLHHDKKPVASTVNFVNRNFANKHGIVLMVQAQYSGKITDFTSETISKLIQQGYEDALSK